MSFKRSLVLLAFSVSNWSSFVAASAASDWPALRTIPDNYQVCPGTLVQVSNMPEVRSEDGMSICYAMVAWTLNRQYECRTGIDKICQAGNPSTAKNKAQITSVLSFVLAGEVSSNPRFDIDYNSGGTISDAIGKFPFESISEDCFNWDQFISNNKDDTLAMVKGLESLKTRYLASKSKVNTEAGICIDCAAKTANDLAPQLAAGMNAFFNIKNSNDIYAKALSDSQDQTFEEFLYQTIIPEACKNNNLHKGGVELGTYPDEGSLRDFQDMNLNLNKVLKQNRPVSVDACLSRPATANMQDCDDGNHGMIIAGTAVMCQAKCPSDPTKLPSGCKHAVQIINSWGQDWQDTHHQGWMDADNLFPYVDKGANVLQWISD